MKKLLQAIYSAADEAAVGPILDALQAKDFRVKNADAPKKGEAVLLFLSAAFAADEAAQERFFAAESAGAAVVPVDLDGAAQPELIASALMAKNAIAAQGRTTEEIAARIASAEAFAEKGMPKKLSRVLIAAAALLILAAGLWIWRSTPTRAEKRERAAVLAAAQAKYGLSEEDLAEFRYVYIVSDGFYPLREDESDRAYTIFPNHEMQDDGVHWTSHEDGQRIYAAPWNAGDWDVIKLMPNLEGLIIVLADVGTLPDLSGLEHLDWMQIIDSNITDISGLAGSSLTYFGSFRCPVEDYSPLNSCEKLVSVAMEFDFLEKADLSGFAPPALKSAFFGYGRAPLELDLSGLKNCTALEELKLESLPCGEYDANNPILENLDFLTGLPNLKELMLEDLGRLRDVSALATLPALEKLTIDRCERLIDISAIGELRELKELALEDCILIRDYSPVGGCTALRSFRVEGMNRFRNNAFLASLPELEDVTLHVVTMPDLDFLNALPEDRTISLAFSGGIGDYSALAHIRRYSYLHVNPSGGDVSELLGYLQGATVNTLHLHDCDGLDLSLLPKVTTRLEIWNSDLKDFTGLPPLRARELQLVEMPALTSLDGLESMPLFRSGTSFDLSIENCPRLTDWSAMDDMSVFRLSISGGYSLPALDNINFQYLELRNSTALEDLHFLDGKREGWRYGGITLVGVDALRDLTPLRRVIGGKLTVEPRLAEQAEELVALGAVEEVEISYPEEGWQLDEGPVALLSLDELQTLPGALLARVEELCLAGDEIVDTARYELTERDGAYVLRDRESGEETALAPEGGLSALPDLSSLTGLRRLELIAQPLENLEGIQTLGALEELSVRSCPQLEDVSAAFTLQGLRTLSLRGCPVGSLQGVQNLTELEELEVRGTAVTDLTPLLALDGLRAVWISEDMTEAAASLDGRQFGFELKIEG